MRRILSSATLIGLLLPSMLFAQTAKTTKITFMLIEHEAAFMRPVDVAAGEKATNFGDILVPQQRSVPYTKNVLKEALTQLIETSKQSDQGKIGLSGLYTALFDSNDLIIRSVSAPRDGVVYIDLEGRLGLNGDGDDVRYDVQITETIKANAKGVQSVYVTLNKKRSEWLANADAKGREDQREWPVLDDAYDALRKNRGLSGYRFVLSTMDTPPTIVNDEATITFNGWFIKTKPRASKLNTNAFFKAIANTLKQNHNLTSVTFMFNGQPKTY